MAGGRLTGGPPELKEERMMSDGGRAQQAGQTAREQTSAAAGEARQAADKVAAGAAEQARAVADEARQQAGSVAHDLQDRVKGEAQGQTRRASVTLRQWADDLSSLVEDASYDSPARNLVAQAADGTHRAADYLERQGVDGLLGDLQGFARRRPAAFLGGAVLAGLVVGRLAKASNGSGTDTRSPKSPPALGPPEQPEQPGLTAARQDRTTALPDGSATAPPGLPNYPYPGV
jgi:hypothetical protein